MDNDKIATHSPAAGSDFVIRIDLEEHGFDGRSEQIWVSRLDDYRFKVLSIPFFSYGIAPSDIVETDESFTVTSVVSRSGNRLLRIGVASESEQLRDSLHDALEQEGLEHEWRGDWYVAALLPSSTTPFLIARLIQENDGTLYHEFAET